MREAFTKSERGLRGVTVISLIVVPLGVFGLSGGYHISEGFVKVSFSPSIYLGAVLLAILTTIIGSLKPAHIAGGISPIEALRYQEYSVKLQKSNKTSHSSKLYRMGWRNIFRNKKALF